MNFDSFEKIVGACGVETAAGIGATNDFEDGIDELLVTADDAVDDATEDFCKQIQGIQQVG